jgi:F-type H+-transporting ATPase subunit delta
MSLRTSATRYAKALFDVALQESNPAEIERDLASIVSAMQESAELRRALTNPGIPQQVRANVMRAVVEKVGTQPPVAKLMAMLAERGRLDLVPLLYEVYRERLLAHANIVRAAVTSATPLSSQQQQALEQSLGTLTGKQVQLEVDVDPALIGGVVTRIGSTVYDGSIRTQLQRMKEKLLQEA